jgi:hypothetical protein
MGATFTSNGDWEGRIRTTFETAKSVAGKTPQDGYLFRRKILVLERQRVGKGLTAWVSTTGNSTTGDNLSFKNGADTLTGGAGDTYMLKTNNCLPNPQGSGIWLETQVAVSFQEWAEWEIP